MKHNPTPLFKAILVIAVLCSGIHNLKAQINPFWNTNGNAATNGNFLGTTNNEPLIFKTNSLEALRIKPNGEIKVASFENLGKGIVTFNNNGVLTTRVFPNDTNQVFAGSGTFKSIAALSGWTRTGNVLYNAPGVNVGIGTSAPQYLLTVNGDAFFNGYVYATGVVLVNKMLVDTLQTGSIFSLNNNLHMGAGNLNEIYTTTGELRFQSNAGNSANTIFSAGTSGNVGIGTFNPQYKLDVTGMIRVTDRILVNRLVPLPGDSVVHIGDSSITFNNNTNVISATVSVNAFRGLGLGWNQTRPKGFQSLAMGTNVQTALTANNAVVLGSGFSALFPLVNSTPKSLMIGFNSNLPTMFVAPAAGVGTVGKIGIGTVQPEILFQVGDGVGKITMAPTLNGGQGAQSTLGFNVHLDPVSGDYVARGNGTFNSGSAITQNEDGGLRFYVFGNTGGADQSVDENHFESLSILTLRKERVQIGGAELSATSPFNNFNTKLTVDGRIVCRDLVVSEIDWQDEVFDSTYCLMPLDSVAAYISANGHLPGFKDEKTIEANGMSVSETVATQQQKIEELTLYLIELNERLKVIEEENRKLKEEQPK